MFSSNGYSWWNANLCNLQLIKHYWFFLFNIGGRENKTISQEEKATRQWNLIESILMLK